MKIRVDLPQSPMAGGACPHRLVSLVCVEEPVMEMKLRLRWVLLVCGMLLGTAVCAAQTEEVPMVTGQHWVKSTEEMKKAYLLGMANVIQVETLYGATNPQQDAHSIAARATRGLRGHSLDSVREGVNRWYAANPDRLQRPVIETIWFEMVVPGLKSK